MFVGIVVTVPLISFEEVSATCSFAWILALAPFYLFFTWGLRRDQQWVIIVHIRGIFSLLCTFTLACHTMITRRLSSAEMQSKSALYTLTK